MSSICRNRNGRISHFESSPAYVGGRRASNVKKLVEFPTFQETIPLYSSRGGPSKGLINGIASGPSRWNRISNGTTMDEIELKVELLQTSATNLAAEWIRFSLVYDRQCSGQNFSYANVFSSTDNTGVETSTIASSQNEDWKDRFCLIYDRMFQMPNVYTFTSTFGTSQGLIMTTEERTIYETIDLKELWSKYGGDDVTYPSINTGALWWMIEGDVGGQWGMKIAYTLKFHDA